jgi:hypothetical protein
MLINILSMGNISNITTSTGLLILNLINDLCGHAAEINS